MWCLLLSLLQSEAAEKRALVVAVADYPADSGYRDLNTLNDEELILAALRHEGFKKDRIARIEDAKATRDGIVSGLEALIEASGPGDQVIFHYSGHGHQITDNNGDEIDGLDEVLVPYGASSIVKNNDGSKHLRDDDLGALLDRLRIKVGGTGSVLVTIDACHSVSATRGADDELAVRGGMEPIGAPSKKRSQRAEAGGVFEGGAPSAGKAPLIVISAARHDEQARETRDKDGRAVGALSLAFSEALVTAKKGTTWRQLFGQVQGAMAQTVPKQTPQLEGDVDTAVFGGEVVDDSWYYYVTSLLDRGVSVEGGWLTGLSEGSEVQFFSEEHPDRVIGTGRVIATTDTDSVVEITSGDTPSPQDRMRVTQLGLGSFQLKVKIGKSVPDQAAILSALSLPNVQIVEEAADLEIRAERGKIEVVRSDGTSKPVDSGPAAVDEVRAFARSQTLRRIEMQDPGIQVRLKLLPARHTYDPADGHCTGSTLLPEDSYAKDGPMMLREGDGYLLSFENLGKEPAYLTVLDLMPDHEVAQLFPLPGQLGSDNLLPAGATFVAKDLCVEAAAPFGSETLKLFATRERIDFEPLITVGLSRDAAAAGPLEQILVDSYAGTRAKVATIPKQTGTTDSITIQVLPRE